MNIPILISIHEDFNHVFKIYLSKLLFFTSQLQYIRVISEFEVKERITHCETMI